MGGLGGHWGRRSGYAAGSLAKIPSIFRSKVRGSFRYGPLVQSGKFRRLDRAVVGSLMAGLVQLVGGRLDVSSVDALCWIAVPNPFERLGQGLGYGRTINVCGVTGKDELVMITLRG